MNSPRFIRFSPSQHSGEIHVRTDAVVAISPDSIHGLVKAPDGTGSVIHVYGNGLVYVKESPSQVIEALRAAGDTKDVSIEIVMPDEEPVGLRALIDDIENLSEIALLMEQRDEALADAKIADERAEWYKRRAEQHLNENDRLKQQLAAAKEASASAIATKRSAHSLQIAALNNEKQCAIADRDRALRDAAYYKQIADSRLDMLGRKQSELDRYAAEIGTEIAKSANLRDERDQLLAKLRETTVALEKANCDLKSAAFSEFLAGQRYAYGRATDHYHGARAY